MGPRRVARHLNLLSRGKLGINLAQLPVDLVLQASDFLADIHLPIGGQRTQLHQLGFKLGNRLFKI